ncbi:hypothetical protein KCW65_20930, partial [Mycobacterium tuberculosis]|nr:hypothetical protein [Mycobacterium tuberculosis]
MTVESAVLLGLSMAVAAGTGLLLVGTPARWLADTADAEAVTGSRAFRPVLLVLAGIVIAGLAAFLVPVGPDWTAIAPGSGT